MVESFTLDLNLQRLHEEDQTSDDVPQFYFTSI